MTEVDVGGLVRAEMFGFLLPSAVKLVIVYIWSCHRRDAQVGNSGGTTDGLGATKKTKKNKKVTVNHVKRFLIKRDGLFVFPLTN